MLLVFIKRYKGMCQLQGRHGRCEHNIGLFCVYIYLGRLSWRVWKSLSYANKDSLLVTNINLKKSSYLYSFSHLYKADTAFHNNFFWNKVRRGHAFLFSTVFVICWLLCKHNLFTGTSKRKKRKRQPFVKMGKLQLSAPKASISSNVMV